jgi:hypothetical protein
MQCRHRGRDRFEPPFSSMSESPSGSRQPATPTRVRSVTWGDAGPLVTGVVRCGPVVRGPGVAQRPERGRRIRASGVGCAMSVGRAPLLGGLGAPSILSPIVAKPRLIASFWYVLHEFGASLDHEAFHSIERIMELGRRRSLRKEQRPFLRVPLGRPIRSPGRISCRESFP